MRYAGNIKVIDQDVGSILGYDPADCSHWKKGKKNIKTLGVFQSISRYLNIDKDCLLALLQVPFLLKKLYSNTKVMVNLAFHKEAEELERPILKLQKNGKDGTTVSFEELFNVNRNKVISAANKS